MLKPPYDRLVWFVSSMLLLMIYSKSVTSKKWKFEKQNLKMFCLNLTISLYLVLPLWWTAYRQTKQFTKIWYCINDRHYDITVGFQKLTLELCYNKVIEPRDSRDIDNFRNQHNQEHIHLCCTNQIWFLQQQKKPDVN